MRLDYALDLLLEKVVWYCLDQLGLNIAEADEIIDKVKWQSKITFKLAATWYGKDITEAVIEQWALEGAFHLLYNRRVGYQMNQKELVRAFRNYLMSAYLEYSPGLERIP